MWACSSVHTQADGILVANKCDFSSGCFILKYKKRKKKKKNFSRALIEFGQGGMEQKENLCLNSCCTLTEPDNSHILIQEKFHIHSFLEPWGVCPNV